MDSLAKLACKWVLDPDEWCDSLWKMSCGEELFRFEADGPHENRFKFCPYCGELIEVDDA